MGSHDFDGFEPFLTFLDRLELKHQFAMTNSAIASSDKLFFHVRDMYGDKTRLAPLAQSTMNERARIDGISIDEPLYRTGELLHDQVEKAHEPAQAVGDQHVAMGSAGTPEMINFYHEFGYPARDGSFVPARPVFKYTGEDLGEQLAEMFSREIAKVFGS